MGNKNGQPADNKLLASSNHKSSALENGQKALKLSREAKSAGDVDLACQHYRESIQHLKQALGESHQPKSIQELLAQAHIEFGDVWLSRQQSGAAREHYEKALKLGHLEAQARLKQLAQPPSSPDSKDQKQSKQLQTTAAALSAVAELTVDLFQPEDKTNPASFPVIFRNNPVVSAEKLEVKSELQTTVQLAQRLAHFSLESKEHKEYRTIALQVVELFGQSKNKDKATIEETMALAGGQDKEMTALLLKHAIQAIRDDVLLAPALLEGLAFILKTANPVQLDADDLVKILMVLNDCKNRLFTQQPDKLLVLLQAINRLLDAMVDCEVSGLSRENLHEPLYESLKSLKKDGNKQIAYLATYACQALVRIPNDETRFRCVLRHVLNLGKGVAGIAGAVKSLDIAQLLKGFGHFREVVRAIGDGVEGLAQAKKEFSLVTQSLAAATKDFKADGISSGLQQLTDAKKLLEKTVSWYDELRFAELLLEANHFTALEQFIKKAQGHLESGFIWGMLRMLEKALQQHTVLESRRGIVLLLGQLFASAHGWDNRYKAQQKVEQALAILSRKTFFGRLVSEDTFWGEGDFLRQEILRLLIDAAKDAELILRSSAIHTLQLLKTLLDLEQRALLDKEVPDLNLLTPRQLSTVVMPSTVLLDKALNRKQEQVDAKLDHLQQSQQKTHTTLEETQQLIKSLDQKTDIATQVKQKLTQHQQRVLANAEVKKELSLYITSQAKQRFNDEKSFDLYNDVNEFLKHATEKVLLVLGSSGAGKTLFGRHLERNTWQMYKPGDAIPLFIALTSIDNPEKNLIEKALTKIGFTVEHIVHLKDHYRFVFWLDGYDEIRGQENLIVSINNQLTTNWQAKVIISCRTEYLQQEKNDYQLKFVPNKDSKPDFAALRERHVASFSPDQIRAYLTNFVQQEKSPWPVSRYETYLNKLPGLQEMLQSPYLLYIAARMLPTLVAQYNKEADFAKLTRAALYESFLNDWFARQLDKFNEQSRLKLLGAQPEKLLREYTQRFAAAMWKAGNLSVVDYNPQEVAAEKAKGWGISLNPFNTVWSLGNIAYRKAKQFSGYAIDWSEFFKADEASVAIRLACPIVKEGEHRYRFIHDSLREYLVCREQFDEASTHARIMPPSVLRQAELKWQQQLQHQVQVKGETQVTRDAKQSLQTEKSVATADQKSSEKIRALTAPSALVQPKPTAFFGGYDLNRRHLNDDPAIIQFHADLLKDDPCYEELLFTFIERSRQELDIVIAAANAMTILNAARVSFSGRNLRGVRIPGADLSYGLFDHTKFQGADLRGINWCGAWLRNADFSQADMQGARFGERLFICTGTPVNAVAYSPDGRYLAIAEGDEITLYIADTQRFICTLRNEKNDKYSDDEHSGECNTVTSIAWDAKGEKLALGSNDCVHVWEVISGRELFQLKGHVGKVTSVAWDGTGQKLASGSYDKTVRVWDTNTGRELLQLTGHMDKVTSVAWDGARQKLASGSYDKTVRVWDANTGRECQTFKNHTDYVRSVAWNAKSGWLASGSDDKTVRVWDIVSGRELQKFTGHTSGVNSVAWDAKNDQLASGGWDKTVRVWDVTQGCAHCKLTRYHTEPVSGVAWNAKNGQLVSAGNWGGYDHDDYDHDNYDDSPMMRVHTVRVWDVSQDRVLRRLGHTSSVSSLVWDKGGRLASISPGDRTVQVLDTAKLQVSWWSTTERLSLVAWDAKDKLLASGSSARNSISVWDMVQRRMLQRLWLGEYIVPISSLAFDAKVEYLAAGGWDRTVRVWNVMTGRQLRHFRGHSHWVTSVAWDAKNGLLASGGRDCTVRVWDVVQGLEYWQFIGHKRWVTTVAWDAKGERIASGSKDHTVCIWELAQGCMCCKLVGHTNEVTNVVWNVKGKQLASGSSDCTVRVWDVTTGACLVVISCPVEVSSISWRPSHRFQQLAIGCVGGIIQLWRFKGQTTAIKAILSDSTHQTTLFLYGANIAGVRGLTDRDIALFEQREAIGEPADAVLDESDLEQLRTFIISTLSSAPGSTAITMLVVEYMQTSLSALFDYRTTLSSNPLIEADSKADLLLSSTSTVASTEQDNTQKDDKRPSLTRYFGSGSPLNQSIGEKKDEKNEKNLQSGLAGQNFEADPPPGMRGGQENIISANASLSSAPSAATSPRPL